MIEILAQTQFADVAPFISQIGWPGVILWIVVNRLDRVEIALTSLSRALWSDLASRTVSAQLRETAAQEIAKIEAKKK